MPPIGSRRSTKSMIGAFALAMQSLAACATGLDAEPPWTGTTGDGGTVPTSSSGVPTFGNRPDAGSTLDAGSTSQPPGTLDAGDPVFDSGGGSFDDTTVGSGGSSGSGGSCTTPLCTTDSNECGCTATDSQGRVVLLGCLPGGGCGCFDAQKTLQGGVFLDAVACTSSQAAAQAFIQYCPCN